MVQHELSETASKVLTIVRQLVAEDRGAEATFINVRHNAHKIGLHGSDFNSIDGQISSALIEIERAGITRQTITGWKLV